MKSAVLFAAGTGTRLQSAGPKCLSMVGGMSLLERYLRALSAVQIDKIFVVTGQQSTALENAINSLIRDFPVETVRNSFCTKGALSSLYAALEVVEGPALLMDADVLFPIEALSRVVNRTGSAILMDTSHSSNGEEMMVGLDSGGLVREISRHLSGTWSRSGEGLGIVLLDRAGVEHVRHVARQLRERSDWHSLEWEVAVSLSAQDIAIAGVDVSSLPWIEIDFPEDLSVARNLVPSVETLDFKYLQRRAL